MTDRGPTQNVTRRVPALLLIAFCLQVFLFIEIVRAQDADTVPPDAARGGLWLRGEHDAGYQPAPVLETAVTMGVSGMLVRATVHQRFRNPGTAWAEGIYVFPLPGNAAVDHLVMRIGERLIEGQIRERTEAKRLYVQAKKAGRRASLVEQERPNVFTTSVANIAPGETIEVEIRYQQTVRFVDGAFHLRLPLVVGPRYIPGPPLSPGGLPESFAGTGWALPTDQVPDAGRITPPVAPPGRAPANAVTIDVHLDAGIPLARIHSPYHRITQRPADDGSYDISLAGGPVPAGRDFELVWTPANDAAPAAALFTQRHDGERYGLLMLVPPREPAAAPVIAREVVFVIDTSGSMHGESMEQARQALTLALDRLAEHDKFNIISFNDRPGRLFVEARMATAQNLGLARRFVARLRAEGGTEMRPALEMALARRTQSPALRQVIFLTDGAVGNEAQLFGVIRRRLGDSRLFTIGIGSAPNGHFMRKAAEYGRGSFTYIGDAREVGDRISALFRRLERPALTDIRLKFPPGNEVAVLPRRIPDLYVGEPLLLALRGPDLPPWIVVHGRLGGAPWRMQLALVGGREGATVAPEWGRRAIAGLMDRIREADSVERREALKREIIDTALGFHLVSRYTALVAVDVTPARGDGESLKGHAMKTRLPDGWSYGKVFGMPGTATPAPLHLLAGMLLLCLAVGLAWNLRWRA